ncbi:WD40 domain-containing protein [Rhizoctonia solani AG-1 IA]|uniref:WD40 domain-containing protein n=1 Tax=Thanatephorus cucumeris (strain AG1-IA) TaxID=983506 RepID=L8WYR0_THACA|nr:WD40 domain-containing protein [Rhizoctonia solani AG-1 IA]
MSDLRVTTNQAHDPGFSTFELVETDTKVCCRRLYTGGNDSLVRVWDTALGAEQEPQVLGEADSSCYTASKDSSVRHYDANNEFTELVAEAAGLCVRCIEFFLSLGLINMCPRDTIVKIINTTTTSRVALLDGHKKGLRSATWDPKGRYLVSSNRNINLQLEFTIVQTTCGQDGQIVVWDVKEPLQASQSPEFHYNCAAVWHPSGMYFATVSASHVYAPLYSLTSYSQVATCLVFSPNGSYLASGGTDNKVIVWDLLDKKAKWRSVYCFLKLPDAQTYSAFKYTSRTARQGSYSNWIPSSRKYACMDDRRSIAAMEHTTSTSMVDDAMVDDDLAGVDDDYGDDWIVDDLGDGAHLDEPQEPAAGTKGKSKKQRLSGDKGGVREMVNITKAQPPFQPGATAFRNKKRYMAYNMKGVIECTNLDVHYVINVEFHDRSFHQNIHFQDVNRFDIASLGEYGVAFACPPDNGHFAIIEYRPYSEWSPNAQWQFKLPEGEHVIALAAAGTPAGRMIQMRYENKLYASSTVLIIECSGGKYEGFGMVAAATNKGYIRFISGGGVQEYIMSAAGDVVSMTGGKEWVFIVHREGGTSLDGCQNLRYSLVAVDGFDLVQEGRLPVPRGETLKWIGVTTEGVSLKQDQPAPRWVPVLDSNMLSRRVGKDETYWPVGLSSSQFHCIILKGRETEPGFPRPLVQDLEVRTPLLIPEQESGEQEEQLFREMLHHTALQDSQLHEEEESEEVTRGKLSIDRLILILIQGACKSGQHARAIDLASMLRSFASIERASQIAGFYHLRGLQERFNAMREAREEDDGAAETIARESWDRASDAIPDKVGQFSSSGRRNGRQQYFDEFAPPPVITRRSLAAATPIVVNDDIPEPSSSMAIDETSAPTEAKRKRPEEDTWDIEMEDDGADFKRQNVQKVDAPKLGATKSNSGNPFARKATGNPFAKKAAQATAPATKSTSFFDKVDAAESAGPKREFHLSPINGLELIRALGGAKFAPKATSRQTTLFGMSAKNASSAQSNSQSETNDGETQLEDPEQTQ